MHSGKFSRDGKQFSCLVDYLLDVELMAFCDLKVSGIVPGGNGHDPCAECYVDRIVLDDRCGYGAIYPVWNFKSLAVLEIFVPLVIGVHDDIFITELRFGAGGAYRERAILEIIKNILAFLIFSLKVGKRGLVFGAPVANALSPIDKVVFPHTLEGIVDDFDNARVEREYVP